MESQKKTETSSTWIRVGCKPLSVNQATYGKKTKTQQYRDYERELIGSLPDLPIPKTGKLLLKLIVTYARASSDIDNALKPFIDVLQKRYDFNDNRIYKLSVEKRVDKEKEGLKFQIKEIEERDTHDPSKTKDSTSKSR